MFEYGAYVNPNYLQYSGSTQKNRYPKIIQSAVTLKPSAKRLLSFGSSTGEEVFTLAENFPKAKEIVGVEIDTYRVQQARRSNNDPRVHFHDTLGALGKFDLALALNVFFRIDGNIDKKIWEKTLKELSEHISPGGILMIFKSEHDIDEVLGRKFKPINVWTHIHNRNGKELYCGYYRRKYF